MVLGGKPESSSGQEAQCLARFLGPAKEGAGALSYRGRLGQGGGSVEGMSVSPWRWGTHSKLRSTGSSQGKDPGSTGATCQGQGTDWPGRLYSVQPSFPSQDLQPGPSLPEELCDSQDPSRGGIPSTPPGEGATSRHLPPPLPVPSLASSVSKHTGSWLAVYLGVRNIKFQIHSHSFSSHLMSDQASPNCSLSSRPTDLTADSICPLG